MESQAIFQAKTPAKNVSIVLLPSTGLGSLYVDNGLKEDTGTIFEYSGQYGMTAWDVSNLFILIVPATLVPIAYYASYEGAGSKLADFSNQCTKCGLGRGM